MSPQQPPKVRRLKPNHGCETPGSLLFLDCEAKQEVIRAKPLKTIQSFRLGVATHLRYDRGEISRRDEIATTDWLEMWDWIESKQLKSRPLWIYAHNAAYDLTLLHFWELCQLGRFRIGSTKPEDSGGLLNGKRPYRGRLCLDGFPFFVYCLGQHGVVKICDSANYFPQKLEQIGEALGYPKMAWPGFDADDETMTAYCRRDVEIVEKAIVRTLDLWRESDGGVWQPTAAMLALTSFRHKLPSQRSNGTQPHVLLDSKDEWQELERAGYYGGQTSCYYIGAVLPFDPERDDLRRKVHLEADEPPTGPVYLLDVRSLYPSLMRDGRFPFRRLFQRQTMPVSELHKTMRAYGAIARVLVDSDGNDYTLRTEKGQLQATGRFETVLAGPELLRALDAGDVRKVMQVQVYCIDHLFRDWVDAWTRRRDQADADGDRWSGEFVKMILNSLSGKFAQTGKRWEDRPKMVAPSDWGYWMEIDADTRSVRTMRSIAGVVQEEVAGDPPWYTFPAISAYVTAMGREHMRWLRGLCPPRSVLYQATDSLMLTREGYYALEAAGLVRERELGYLQLKTVGDYGEVLGCNHYRIGEQWVRSGAWGRAVRQEDGTYTYLSFEGSKSILAQQPDGTVRVDEYALRRIDPYHKGTVAASGWVSLPKLGEEEVPF